MAESESKELVDTEEARLLIAEHEVRVIDVRGAEEFADHRIPGAVNEPELDPESLGGDADDEAEMRILVVCEDGEKSREVAGKLRDHGLEAASLDGGMSSWKGDKMPIQPSSDPEEGEREPPKLPGAGT